MHDELLSEELAGFSVELDKEAKRLSVGRHAIGGYASRANELLSAVNLSGATKAISYMKKTFRLAQEAQRLEKELARLCADISENVYQAAEAANDVGEGELMGKKSNCDFARSIAEEMERNEDNFVVEQGGRVVAGAETYREAVELKARMFPLGEVRLGGGSRRKNLSHLPLADGPEAPDL